MSTNGTQTVTVNGRDYTTDQVATALNALTGNRGVKGTTSSLRTPSDLLSRFGRTYDGERDVWESLGYDEQPEFEDLEKKYIRNDIAGRIVDLPAKDSWKEPPAIAEAEDDAESQLAEVATEWIEDTFQAIARRADISAGIGEYGLLFFGFADADEAGDAEPFATSAFDSTFSGDPLEDIAYFEVFNQGDVVDWSLGREVGADESDPMFNRPVEYDIEFTEGQGDPNDDESGTTRTVHHSRLLHIPADEPIFSSLKGQPRLLSIYNRLEDLEKAVGAAAEATWHSADRKYQFDIRDEFADLPQTELDSLSTEVEKLVHDLQPYIKTQGMDLNVISGEDIDPSGTVGELKALIAGGTGIPQRKLFGSERGEQASTQDRANWFDNISSRQSNYCEEFILRPAVDRLVALGILPDDSAGYVVEWPNLFEPTSKEESEIQANRAQAVKNMAPQANTDLLPGGLEGVLEYIETGEFPEDAEDPLAALGALDESDPEVARQFEAVSGDE